MTRGQDVEKRLAHLESMMEDGLLRLAQGVEGFREPYNNLVTKTREFIDDIKTFNENDARYVQDIYTREYHIRRMELLRFKFDVIQRGLQYTNGKNDSQRRDALMDEMLKLLASPDFKL